MTRVLARVATWGALALTAALLAHSTPAEADPPAFVATGHSPTQGLPVPGGYLTADLGLWSSPPDPGTYEYQWLRDGVPIPDATDRDYLIQVVDLGHDLAPHVTGHSGTSTADFLGTPMTVRKIGSSLRLDVRRVHPAPTKKRLVWMAISFMTTERPWPTDGGTVTAYKKKDGQLKSLGASVVARGAAFVRLPWRRPPHDRTKVLVCYEGSEVVAASCSGFDVVRRDRQRP